MKYLNIRSILPVAIVAALAFTGCKKGFLDVNTDPNRVTDDNITPQLIFTQAANGVGTRQATGGFTFLNNWMGYLAGSGDFAIPQIETSYNIDFSFGDGLWQGHYGVLFDLETTRQKALVGGDSALAAASLILSAKLWQEIVDIFGNAPYSEAFKNSTTRTPKYDDAKSIYTSLQGNLDQAITWMKGTIRSTFDSADIVNHGNASLWIKFANTLKLRLLIRQSEIPGFNPASEIAKITANGGGFLGAGQSINVNPGYVNDVNKQSPFYANYGFTPTGVDANTSERANQYFVTLLNGTGDPRLKRFYTPIGSTVVGGTYGFGSNPFGNVSSKFGPGLIGSATQPQWILTSFESLFLQAEAMARGWIPGSAQTTYQAAVTESFVWLGVPNAVAAATDYYTNVSIAQWANAGATALSKAKFITYQKYISNCGVDPQESWADHRRLNMIPNTGYISVNPSKISNSLPIRLLYPQSEYTTNAANVTAQGTINQFTTKLFWEP
jgi:Starch-binding associating with outer membrane